ncbi:Dabb family protein [Aeromicrobium wangtongii]|uniref:Dabb family protein n=1 Tax=Aeromicrobium wangtongii TaxID=2969247 RepID=A0ABY5MDE6_9ACTN|nr:Dabb family protein [Aeromicrobium wangtongii]MCD9197462.1 Dabb family protein [Aeromicrobium wangtongii]UUP14954.1 Dabb family protein [Aeromicrobium wangtongii]
MFNHVGHLTLVPEATDDQIEGIVAGLLGLPAQIDGLVEAQVVRDAGLTPGNANLRFQMRFDSVESWQGYKTHPAHVAVVTDHIGPVLGSKAFVQYEDDAVRSAGA